MLNSKNVSFNHTLEEYKKKYGNSAKLKKVTKLEADKTPSLLDRKHWWFINNTYYEVPTKKNIASWWNALPKAAKIAACAIAGVGVVSAVVFPTLAATVWNKDNGPKQEMSVSVSNKNVDVDEGVDIVAKSGDAALTGVNYEFSDPTSAVVENGKLKGAADGLGGLITVTAKKKGYKDASVEVSLGSFNKLKINDSGVVEGDSNPISGTVIIPEVKYNSDGNKIIINKIDDFFLEQRTVNIDKIVLSSGIYDVGLSCLTQYIPTYYVNSQYCAKIGVDDGNMSSIYSGASAIYIKDTLNQPSNDDHYIYKKGFRKASSSDRHGYNKYTKN